MTLNANVHRVAMGGLSTLVEKPVVGFSQYEVCRVFAETNLHPSQCKERWAHAAQAMLASHFRLVTYHLPLTQVHFQSAHQGLATELKTKLLNHHIYMCDCSGDWRNHSLIEDDPPPILIYQM